MAPPVSYQVDGIQYLALVAGVAAQPEPLAHLETLGRVFVFKLGGQAPFPAVPRRTPAELNPPAAFGTEAQIAAGEALYGRHCGRCHGRGTEASPGAVPDLRYASAEVHATWPAIVVGGARSPKGMPAFADVLTLEDAEAIRSFVVSRAHQALAEDQPAAD
jgi:mono/diheme cytochrome c family protein